MTTDIAVIAAHPDDEVLGCGGTIARHVARGDRVHVLILAEGATSRDWQRSADQRAPQLSALQSAAREAGRILGVESVQFGGLPDNRMDGLDLLDIIKVVEQFVADCSPSVVYTHHGGDLNVDHQVTQRAVLTAMRPLPESTFDRLMFFEIPSSTEWGGGFGNPFVPHWFEDVTPFFEKKMAALRAYQSEMRAFPHARSYENVESLARVRGASSGLAFAEAFMLGSKVHRWT